MALLGLPISRFILNNLNKENIYSTPSHIVMIFGIEELSFLGDQTVNVASYPTLCGTGTPLLSKIPSSTRFGTVFLVFCYGGFGKKEIDGSSRPLLWPLIMFGTLFNLV